MSIIVCSGLRRAVKKVILFTTSHKNNTRTYQTWRNLNTRRKGKGCIKNLNYSQELAILVILSIVHNTCTKRETLLYIILVQPYPIKLQCLYKDPGLKLVICFCNKPPLYKHTNIYTCQSNTGVVRRGGQPLRIRIKNSFWPNNL